MPVHQQLVADHRYLLLCSYLHCTIHTTALIALLAIYSLPHLSFCSLTEFIPAVTCDLKYSSTHFNSFIFTQFSNCLLATFSFIHNIFIIYKLPLHLLVSVYSNNMFSTIFRHIYWPISFRESFTSLFYKE